MTPEVKAKVDLWLYNKPIAKQWIEYEKTLRLEVTSLCFPNPVAGTQRVNLDSGGKLKLVYGSSYTLGDKELIDPVLQEKVSVKNQVDAALNAIEELGDYGAFLAERLVKWKPELNEPEYKALNKSINDGTASSEEIEAKRIIDSILIIKPASPQLEYEAPKL